MGGQGIIGRKKLEKDRRPLTKKEREERRKKRKLKKSYKKGNWLYYPV